jgi:hypothetical protein
MKRSGDLVKGDNVFIVHLSTKNWRIHTYKVLEIISTLNDLKIIFEDGSWSGYYPRDLVSARSDTVWSDREEALKFAIEKTKKERDYLSRKIDEMISKYDEIEKFIEKYEQQGIF